MHTVTYMQDNHGKVITVTRRARDSEIRAKKFFPIIVEMHECGIADSVIAAALGGELSSEQVRGIRARRDVQGAVKRGKPTKEARAYMVRKAAEIAARHGHRPV